MKCQHINGYVAHVNESMKLGNIGKYESNVIGIYKIILTFNYLKDGCLESTKTIFCLRTRIFSMRSSATVPGICTSCPAPGTTSSGSAGSTTGVNRSIPGPGWEKISVKVIISNHLSLAFLLSLFLEAEETGVSIIHGNSSSFYILFEEIFRQIYKFWQDFSVSTDRLQDAGKTLRIIMKNVTEMTKYQTGKDDKSPCSKVKNIANIMLQKLESRIRIINA